VAKKATGDDVLPARLHSAILHLLRRLAQQDRTSGLSPARLSALSVLVFGGERTIGALASAEGVTPPTMTRLVAGLVADGLVERTGHPTDRRAVRVRATEAGRARLLAGRDRRVAALRELLDPLGPKDRRRLAQAATIVERMLEDRP
jgi:DNA-binding MarR family transcriptional regulator